MPAIRLLSIAGTRPEAIKLAPIALAARGRPGLAHRLLASGQHLAPFDEALAAFGLRADRRMTVPVDPEPDIYVARLVAALAPVLAAEAPTMVLVQGDTSTAYAGALAAREAGLPIAHVEAGLRSGDLANPWPEERNRRAIDRLSTLLFAPTPEAAANLDMEDLAGAVIVTGNSGIDALLTIRDELDPPTPGGRHRLLLTCHRRESFGAGIDAICTAALRLAARGDVSLLVQVHPNPAVSSPLRTRLAGHPAISLVPPLGYREWVAAMASARLILTDSGGIQEEAPALGVPVLVLRHVTERPEGLASGNLRLVGTDPDRIVAEAVRLIEDDDAHAAMARPAFPFGWGRAAARILDQIEQHHARHRADDPALPSPAPQP